jgi:hypothetical protein
MQRGWKNEETLDNQLEPESPLQLQVLGCSQK